jgi:hypothetical protein
VIRIKTEVAGPIGSDFRLLKDIFASLSYLDSSVLAVKQYPRRLIELGIVAARGLSPHEPIDRAT